MTQSKILVDTNAYVRIAKTIRPLLFCEFGENQYCLYIIPELNNELQNKLRIFAYREHLFLRSVNT